jgi:hypothetical protein
VALHQSSFSGRGRQGVGAAEGLRLVLGLEVVLGLEEGLGLKVGFVWKKSRKILLKIGFVSCEGFCFGRLTL